MNTSLRCFNSTTPPPPPTTLTKGELWQFNMPTSKNYGAYFPLLFFRQFRFDITSFLAHSVYQHFTVTHFYQPPFGGDDLVPMIQHVRTADFGYNLRFQTHNWCTEVYMQLNGEKHPSDYQLPHWPHLWTYFGYQYESKINWNEQNTLNLLKERISTLQPNLIIVDFQVDLLKWQCFQETLHTAQNEGTIIWLCCHKQQSVRPKISNNIVDISANTSIEGDVYFKAHIHSFAYHDSKPKQVAFELIKQPKIRRSKYEKKVEEIKQRTLSGEPETKIAGDLKISIYTLRQIKRQFKIRKNMPVKAKRRQGLDAKIMRLCKDIYDSLLPSRNQNSADRQKAPTNDHVTPKFAKLPMAPPSKERIKEIASKLKVAPSYVKKRIDIYIEQQNREQQNSNAEPVKPEPDEVASKGQSLPEKE